MSLDHETSFFKAYNALNDAQRRAVDAIEGPVMVIAGPGTGKTQILSVRIANILRLTDIPPSAILALTFTEAGVRAMRMRLISLIGSAAYHVRIHTFHGFCNGVIRAYPERFPRIIGSEQMSDIEAYTVLEQLVDTGSYTRIRPVYRPYHYVREIRGLIAELKREAISPESLSKRIEEEVSRIEQASDLYHQKGAHAGKMRAEYRDRLDQLEKTKEFQVVYAQYEAQLPHLHRYDFEDTILEVVKALTNDEDLRLILQETHQYILADEHQDANGAQNALLELLSSFHESPNLFIVGDEKQAIYRFQGASLENFLFFKKKYPDALPVVLESNYRSTQIILDAAHQVIVPTESVSETHIPLSAQALHAPSPVTLSVYEDTDAELVGMAQRINDVRKREGETVAVLLRRNADVSVVASALMRQGIPVIASQDLSYTSMYVDTFICLLRAAEDFGNDTLLPQLLYGPLCSASNLDVSRVLARRSFDTTLFEIISNEDTLKDVGVQQPEAFTALFSVLDSVRTRLLRDPLPQVLEYALHESGLIQALLGADRYEEELYRIRACMRFFENAYTTSPTIKLGEALALFEKANAYGISVSHERPEYPGAVRVQTAHRSKGLEFDHVFIPMLTDARWGAKTGRSLIRIPLSREQVDESADERRLLYVAMTRARQMLTCSYSARGTDGKELVPSRFLEDISPEHINRIEHLVPLTDFFTHTAPKSVVPEDERIFVRERFCEQGLSVSALNNYLESPWKYFFHNLLRIPLRRDIHLFYGSAMDAALKYLTRKQASGEEVVADEVVLEFERVLRRMPLSKVDYEVLHARGSAALSGYIVAIRTRETFPSIEASVSIRVSFSTGIAECPDVLLRGELDRVEYADPQAIRIIDFKTGTPKSRNVIEGKTENSNGNYKRQLVFYALMCEADPVRMWRAHEGIIDFVEPDLKGSYRHESFPIVEEDIALLKETIVRVSREIVHGTFFEVPCTPDSWSEEGCALVAAYQKRRQR